MIRKVGLDVALGLGIVAVEDVGSTRSIFKNAAELNPTSADLWLKWSRFERNEGDLPRAADLTLRAVDFFDAEQMLFIAGRELLAIMSTEAFKSKIPFGTRDAFTAGLHSSS